MDEVERLKEICRDIVDLINTSPYLYQEPINYQTVLDKIELLAISGYVSTANLLTENRNRSTEEMM